MERILIVDDDPQIREVIGIYIEQAGMSALEAESGQLTIERLESGQAAASDAKSRPRDGETGDLSASLAARAVRR